MDIAPLCDVRCRLAEGPLWDEREQALYWVDAEEARLYRYDFESAGVREWMLPAPNAGSLALREEGGAIVAMNRGFYLFDFDSGRATPVAEPLSGRDAVRFNDGTTDRQGRFIAGGMDLDEARPLPVGEVCRIDESLGVERIDRGFLCFNGPCFSPDGRRFYCTGRDLRIIEAHDYDPDSGALTGRQEFFRDSDGDGATVDTDGCVWSAQWGRHAVFRITPEGRLDRRVELPGHFVTSVQFGGPDLDVLFVTTLGAPHGDSVPRATDAGAVFAVHGLGCQGIAETRFAG